MVSNSKTIETARKWLNTSGIDTGSYPDIDITSLWNGFIAKVYEVAHTVGDVALLDGSQITLKTVLAGSLVIPAGLYTLLTQDIPWWELIILIWDVWQFPWISFGVEILGEGITIPIPTGFIFWLVFVLLFPTLQVPFSDILSPIQTGNPTKYGGYTAGFSFKDVNYDVIKMWFVRKGVQLLGFDMFRAVQFAVWGYNAFLTRTNNDIYQFLEDEFADDASSTDTKLGSIESQLTTLSTTVQDIAKLIGLKIAFL